MVRTSIGKTVDMVMFFLMFVHGSGFLFLKYSSWNYWSVKMKVFIVAERALYRQIFVGTNSNTWTDGSTCKVTDVCIPLCKNEVLSCCWRLDVEALLPKHCNDRSKYNCWAGKARHLGRLLGKMYAAYEGYCKERPVHWLATSSLFSVRAVNHTDCEYIEVFCLTKYIERFPYFMWC